MSGHPTPQELMRTALQRIVDWSDCRCEDHEGPDCCDATQDDKDYHCPGCIAARALAALSAAAAPDAVQERWRTLLTWVLDQRDDSSDPAAWNAFDAVHRKMDNLVITKPAPAVKKEE